MKSLFQRFFQNLTEHGLEYFKRYYGFYRGVCMNVEDETEQGRILVKVPIVTGDETHPVWAWPIAPWAGKDSGSLSVPDVGDPVYVSFENGDANHPLYFGGWWPKPESGDSYMPEGVYTNGRPTKRFFRTKAGHELSFEDDPDNLSCKVVWHDPEADEYAFLAFTKEGSIQMANRKGCMIEAGATDDEERIMMVDKAGNSVTMDKDGMKLIDTFGNIFEMKDGAIQVIGGGDVVINCAGINMKTGGVTIGDVATDSAVKGTSWLAWWTSTVLVWLNTHTHPTGVGPSGPALVPAQPPNQQLLLTDKLKMQ